MQDLDHQTTTTKPANDSAHLAYTADDQDDLEDLGPSHLAGLTPRRVAIVLGILLVLVLMAVVPPLINVGRYRRRIANSIGLSLGRPVHIDSVTLNILPMPGFTLENFVVQDDPAFGAEPVIRAQQVRATLRISSLWRRRVEFSRIALDDPSVNLVHLPDGQWNLESILLQASRMPAAPTQQKGSGQTPRFPYIEATGGRVNIKMGLEKMPISLTDADFALWLPEPHHWHLRLKATPARTDAASTDTGLLRVEGTLGQAPTLGDVPIDITGRWTAAPLGAVSRILMGRDAGMRGQMTFTAALQGTVDSNRLDTRLELRDVRKADFVPAVLLSADIACTAASSHLFHTLTQLHCSWPPIPQNSTRQPTGLTVTGFIPDIIHPESADLQAHLLNLPASTLLTVLQVVSQRIPPALKASGVVTADASCCIPALPAPLPPGPHRHPTPAPLPPASPGPLSGTFTLTNPQLSGVSDLPFLNQTPHPPGIDPAPSTPQTFVITGAIVGNQLILKPIALPLGAKDPATLDIHADPLGYSIHLAGSLLRSRWNQLVQALPPLGDAIDPMLPKPLSPAPQPATEELPLHIDLTAGRTWSGIPIAVQPASQTPPKRTSSTPRVRPIH